MRWLGLIVGGLFLALVALLPLGQAAEAGALQQTATPGAPPTAEDFYNLGLAAYGRAAYVEAASWFTRAVKVKPDYIDAYYVRALTYDHLQDLPHALADYTRAINLDPSYPSPYLGRGIVYDHMGDKPHAAADYVQWMTLNQAEKVDGDPLKSGQSVTVDMQAGWIYALPIDVQAGQHLTITAEAQSGDSQVDPLLALLDPSGTPVTGNDDVGQDNFGGTVDSRIDDYVAPDSGTYTLLVSHAGGGSVGKIKVTLLVAQD